MNRLTISLALMAAIASACSDTGSEPVEPDPASTDAPTGERSQEATATSGNLLANGTFESGVAGWSSFHGTVVSSTLYHTGYKSAQACPVTSGSVFTLDESPSSVLNPKNGETYTATAWVRAKSGTGQVRLAMRIWTAGSVTASQTATLAIDSTWRQVTVSRTLTSDASELDVVVFGASGTCFLIDDIVLTRTAPATAPAPAPSPAPTCTSFTYSGWGTCQGGLQTRTVTSQSPAGCTGGNPVLSQACTVAQPTGSLPAGYMTVDQWEQRFLSYDRSTSPLQGYDVAGTADSGGIPKGCKQIWQTANNRWRFDTTHCVDSAIKMWEATRKAAYLDRSLKYFEDTMAASAPVNTLTRAHALSVGCLDSYVGSNGCIGSSFASRSDASQYRGWQAWGAGAIGDEYPLYEGSIFSFATYLLLEMKVQGLNTDPAYAARYNALLAFIKHNVWNKWYARGVQNFYRILVHMSVDWAHTAMNLYLLSDPGDPNYNQYHDIYSNMARNGLPHFSWSPDPAGASLHGTQAKPRSDDPNAFVTYQTWNATNPEQQGYADRFVFFVVQCNRRDPACVFTDSDITKFQKTLTNYIWKDPAGANCHSALTDGVGCGGASNTAGATGAYQLGWSRLGRYNNPLGLEIQKRFELYESKLNKGWPISRAASGALNARLLANPE